MHSSGCYGGDREAPRSRRIRMPSGWEHRSGQSAFIPARCRHCCDTTRNRQEGTRRASIPVTLSDCRWVRGQCASIRYALGRGYGRLVCVVTGRSRRRSSRMAVYAAGHGPARTPREAIRLGGARRGVGRQVQRARRCEVEPATERAAPRRGRRPHAGPGTGRRLRRGRRRRRRPSRTRGASMASVMNRCSRPSSAPGSGPALPGPWPLEAFLHGPAHPATRTRAVRAPGG